MSYKELPLELKVEIAKAKGGHNLWQTEQQMVKEARRLRELSMAQSMAHYELVMRFKDSLTSKHRIEEALELLFALLKEPQSSHLLKDTGFFKYLNGHNLMHDLQFDLPVHTVHNIQYMDIPRRLNPKRELSLPHVLDYCNKQHKLTELAEAMLTHVTIEKNNALTGYDKIYTSKPTRMYSFNSDWHSDYSLEYCILENGPNKLFLRDTYIKTGQTFQKCILQQANGETEWTAFINPNPFTTNDGYHLYIAEAVRHLLMLCTVDNSKEPPQITNFLKASFADVCLQ